ncbi:MAG: hypothetical protein WA853_18320 [Candidatus Acidiferrum sp.]
MARSREIVAALTATCFATCLMITPARGATAEALGTVVASENANVSGVGASVGTTVFPGDNLSTADTGSVQLRAGAARFELAASSSATISAEGGMPRATLLHGSAMFSTANAQAFALYFSKAVIRPQSNEPTIGQVTVLGERELQVKSVRGALTITVEDDSRVIPEGSSYRILLDPTAEEAAQSQPPTMGSGGKGMGKPPISAGSSKFVWWATGAVVLLTVFAVHKALESPDRP